MSIACIDGDWIPFVSCYNKADSGGEKTLEEAIIYADKLIQNVLDSTKCDSYIMALTKGKCFRYSIYPEYKGNRKYKQQLNYFREVKQHLINKWGAMYFEELEADDIVNICRKEYPDAFIVSVDKDLLSLEGEHYNPKEKAWVVTSPNKALYDFCTDMIIGQPGDNIKGIKGRGKAYADNVLGKHFGNPELLDIVFRSYLVNYKSNIDAIDEFYRNFRCLSIVDKWEGFEVPKPIKVYKEEEDEFEERVIK